MARSRRSSSLLPWRPAWLSEYRRSLLVVVVATIATAPVLVVLDGQADGPLRSVDTMIVVLTLYLAIYSALTVAVHARCSTGQVRDWVRSTGRGSWFTRYVAGTAPGPGLGVFIGIVALGAVITWLPRDNLAESGLPPALRLMVGTVLIVVAWGSMTISFAVAYRAEDLLIDEPALVFPRTDRPVWSDYVYLAVSLSTSFGSSDVAVTTTGARRTVAVHSVLSFVYNTVIIGVVVSVVASA